MQKFKISPYFWISNFRNQKYILNKGSKQKIIEKDIYLNILKIVKIFKIPRTLKEVKMIINQEKNYKQLSKTFRFLINQNLLIDNKYSPDSTYSRNHLFFNYKYGKFLNFEQKLKTKKILILGCGGIGNFISYFLLSIGIKNFILIDGDKIEITNLNRQFLFKKTDINFYKVDILKRELLNINPQINVITHNVFIDNENQLTKVIVKKPDLIIVSADEKKVLKESVKYSVKNKIPLLNIGYLNDISVVGPFFIPDETACPFCGLAITKNNLKNININQKFSKAPSIFTNNSLSSSLASSEILNYFFDKKQMLSINQRVGINCMTFDKLYLKIKPNPNCLSCKNF